MSKIDDESNDRLIELFGTPTPEPAAMPVIDSATPEDPNAADEEPDAPCSDEVVPVKPDSARRSADLEPEQPVAIVDSAEAVASGEEPDSFDQLVLLREPVGERLPPGLTVAEQIDAIMKRKEIELVLLDGPPRLEGVCWDPKKAARADEIIAFIMLNGPSTLRQVALALWPDHPRPDKTASQQISRARSLLGQDNAGQSRLSVGNRAAPFVVHDVGCDWNRFEQLVELSRLAVHSPDKSKLLATALTLARSAPFIGARVNSFLWAADLCFDSRMRLKVDAAAVTLADLSDSSDDREQAGAVRLVMSV